MASESPLNDPDDMRSHMFDLEQKLTFQQRSFDELNGVVLEQQAEITALRREVESLRLIIQRLADRGIGDDLPHEKPPHY